MMKIRQLARFEISKIWEIDRSEIHHHIYQLVNGRLGLVPSYFDLKGWPPDQMVEDTPKLDACFERGGAFIGMFDSQKLIGVTVVDSVPLGADGGLRQLKYLYVSASYRQKGIGRTLFREAQSVAQTWGATQLYISATPTENTVNFYLNCGAELAVPPLPDLFALEPEDIHLVCAV